MEHKYKARKAVAATPRFGRRALPARFRVSECRQSRKRGSRSGGTHDEQTGRNLHARCGRFQGYCAGSLEHMRRILVVLATMLLHMPAARAESLSFELFEVSNGKRGALLASGVRNYSVQDVQVETRSSSQGSWKSKAIPVAAGFNAGASIYPERDLTGFGLWLKGGDSWIAQLSGGGFSWDWFERESGNVYRKLQGGGRVRVTPASSPNELEIGTVEVLEDIVLRVNVRPWFFFTSTDTHHLLLKKGSVLRFSL